jgi:hypothetical protein
MDYYIPVSLSTTILLGLLWISIDETILGKVTRQMLFWSGSTVSKAGVVTIVLLMGASHCETDVSICIAS